MAANRTPMPDDTHSLIVRIWFEETDGENGVLVRRGSIEHVSSKRRIYFQDMEKILWFIEEEAGVDPTASPFAAEAHPDLAGI
jgi:hypothetical protein